MPPPTPYSCPCLLLLLLNLPLLLSGSLLLCLALWLSSKPNQSLPLHLLEPLQLPLLLTCLVGGLYLIIVPAVGALAAVKQKRYVTATVRFPLTSQNFSLMNYILSQYMLLVFLLLLAESVSTVLFLLYQQSAATMLQVRCFISSHQALLNTVSSNLF